MKIFRIILFCLLLFATVHSYGQSPQVIKKILSLKDEHIQFESTKFKVIKVVDGREVKLHAGIVRKGLNNKMMFADFERPAEEEIGELLLRSSQARIQTYSIVMRIDQLQIMEVATDWSESAIAEIVVDFFFELDDSLYFLTRKHASARKKGLEVTNFHNSNIATAVERVVMEFSQYDLEGFVINESPISWSEVAGYRPHLFSEIPPILEDLFYQEGVYTSFEEFRANKPGVWDGYEVSQKSKISLRWLNENGKMRKADYPVFALAHNNTLYIHFEEEFYPLEKRSNTLIFFGSPQVDPHQAGQSALGGLGGVTVRTAGKNIRVAYEIDLNSGLIKRLGFAK